jgi:ribosome-binding factor A
VGVSRTSPDLKVATVYVAPLGGQGEEELIKILARNRGELRHQVAKEMSLKFAPDLRFRIDETFDRLDETRRMFSDETVQRDIARHDDNDDEGDL